MLGKAKIILAFVRTIAYNVYRNHTWEVFLLAKTANLYARIEPDLKEQAEAILAALGIPASNAITMFYRQIILQQGLPFDVKLPAAKPVDLSRLTPEQLSEELEKGYSDILAGKTKPVKQVFDSIRKDYGL